MAIIVTCFTRYCTRAYTKRWNASGTYRVTGYIPSLPAFFTLPTTKTDVCCLQDVLGVPTDKISSFFFPREMVQNNHIYY